MTERHDGKTNQEMSLNSLNVTNALRRVRQNQGGEGDHQMITLYTGLSRGIRQAIREGRIVTITTNGNIRGVSPNPRIVRG